MRQVTLTRDMKPWRANATPVLPDDLAAKLIAAGDATAYEPKQDDIRFKPDAPTKPRTSYFTRGKR